VEKFREVTSFSTHSSGVSMDANYKTFAEFYPFYLSEHNSPRNRRLHFIGTAAVLLALIVFLLTMNWLFLAAVPVLGYGFAWVGHFIVERNRPATFSHPLYSLMGDFVMFKDILTGKIKI
jgi:hypothetical protein